MRTTLNMDDDRLMPVKYVSGSLQGSMTGSGESALVARGLVVAGFVPFDAHPSVVMTNEIINRLRDEEGI